jgi:hypothetical protein
MEDPEARTKTDFDGEIDEVAYREMKSLRLK